MRVLIDGKDVPDLTPAIIRAIAPGRPADTAEGEILSDTDAEAAVMRRVRWMLIALTGITALFIGLILIAALSECTFEERLIIFPVTIVLIACLAFMFRWRYRKSRREWLAKAAMRTMAWPPPGTRVRADAVGLTVGGRAAAWPELRPDRVELTDVTHDGDRTLILTLLSLETSGPPIVLDSMMMTNGAAIVAFAWRQLREPA